jgi:hypothetical protein
MAKYYPPYSCGHSREVVLYGPHRERERKLAWLETVPCPACKPKPPVTITARVAGRGTHIELICTHSYDIREQLKERGWRYSPEALAASGPLGLDLLAKPIPGWVFDGTPRMCGEEIAYIRGIAPTAQYVQQDAVTTMMQSIAEGRPDLLPAADR